MVVKVETTATPAHGRTVARRMATAPPSDSPKATMRAAAPGRRGRGRRSGDRAAPTRALEVPARLLVARRLLLAALDPLPGDHLLVAHAGGDHRVDVRLLVDHHLEEGGAGEGDEGLE